MEYIEKLQKAINYVEENIKEDLKLEKISAQCYFSIPHFYRLFQIFTGYSIMDYVRKRRLSLAAQELLTTDKRLIDISFDYRFESQEAFIRAFKRMFGITPGEYRKTHIGIGLFSRLELNKRSINYSGRDMELNPEFTEREFKLTGFEEEIDFSSDFFKTIIFLQERLIKRIGGINNTSSPEEYIAYWYYKWDEGKREQEPAIYYFAAVKANEKYDNVEELITKTIPKSSYAVFNEIRRGEVGGADGYGYKVWFPTAGRELNEAVPGDFEVYEDINDIGPNSKCKIYIPIK